MPQELPSTGFHYGVSFDDYRQWPAANISTIKPIRKTPLHCKWAVDHPSHSAEMDVGSALHVSILEPARFEKEFFIAPEYDGRTKEGKAVAAQCEIDAASRTIIRRKKAESAVDADDVDGMAEAVWQFNAPKRFLEMAGQCEISALWQDPVTGLMCKGRFDKLITAKPPIILEIKTTRDAGAWAFGKQCAEMGYAAQAAYYSWGHQVITGIVPMHTFLAIENKGPWAPKLWTLDNPDLQTGKIQFRNWLDEYAACQKSKQWPGYLDKVEVLTMPNWANKEEPND